MIIIKLQKKKLKNGDTEHKNFIIKYSDVNLQLDYGVYLFWCLLFYVYFRKDIGGFKTLTSEGVRYFLLSFIFKISSWFPYDRGSNLKEEFS